MMKLPFNFSLKVSCNYKQIKETGLDSTATFITFVAIIISFNIISISSEAEVGDVGVGVGNETNIDITSKTENISYSFAKIAVKKCCQLEEYFDIVRGNCELWPTSNGTRWFHADVDVSMESIINATSTSEWKPPTTFYKYFENESLPILRFDPNSTGNPYCWNGKMENIRTEVLTLPQGKGGDLNDNAESNLENEKKYFFIPGTSQLKEVPSPGRKIYHNPDHFCVDVTKTELIFRICGCSDQHPCIRKCCPPGKHLEIAPDDYKCVMDDDDDDDDDDNDLWKLPLHSKPDVLLSKEELKRLQPRYDAEIPNCFSTAVSSGWSMTEVEHGAFIIHQNGSPQHYDLKQQTWSFLLTPSDHCFDRLVGNSTNEVCPGEPEVMIFCVDDDGLEQVYALQRNSTTRKDSQTNDALYTFFVVALVIATLLLLVTAVVVGLLIEKRNIHSWTRLAYVLSHFLFFFLVGLTHVHAVTPLNMEACRAMAILIHFAGLTTACWLSVINFDLWWTFKVLKPNRGHKLDMQRFFWYILFAFGLPIMIIGIALIIEGQEPKFTCRLTSHKKRPIAPHYSDEQRCTMSESGRPAYWFGPLFILLVANLVFFCTTTCRMVGLQRMTRRASIESTSSRSGHTQSRQIFIKIFIVSGVTWWVEIIQWFFTHGQNTWYELILDMIHFAQAIAIFVIFVCKRDVIRNLQIKYPIITRVISPVARIERSGTIGSMSEPNSRSSRIMSKINGRNRKMSNTSFTSTSSSTVVGPNPGYDHGPDSYRRQDSFELPASPGQSQAPTKNTILNFNLNPIDSHSHSTNLPSSSSTSTPISLNPIEKTCKAKQQQVSFQKEGQGQEKNDGQVQVQSQSQGRGQYFHRRETVDEYRAETLTRMESIELDDL